MDLQSQLQKTLGESYTVERELTGGGMARVFVAHDRSLGRRVVIKTLSQDVAVGVSADRFRREIRLAASLQQANIVPVHTTGEINGTPYYTMPFVEGESLRSHLAHVGALPVREAVNIFRDIARALAFAHERGVVHRDIKPENVLLSGSTAVVTDFGIAKAIEASHTNPDAVTLTQMGTALGTPAYISPEQAAGDPNVDHRADIYALGVVAYELLAGQPPFTGRSAQPLMAAHISERPPALGDRCANAPRPLVALIMRCLEKNPALRPQSAMELLQSLDSVVVTPQVALSARPTERRPSVAVLPFANLSPDPENEFFADGITDDLIAQVAKIGSLRVIARTSVMRYRGTQVSARQAAQELGVTAVVEGTVRRAGKRARIVAQLVDAATDAPIWSETYDRDLEDVFSVQSEVATSVASALKASLTPDEEKRLIGRAAVDAATYDLYLLGRHHLNRRTEESLRKAIEYFGQAIDRAPRFAAAHAGLADVYVFAGIGYAQIPPAEAFAKAKQAASQALAIDDALPEALCAMGLAVMQGDWDVPRARDAFERAVVANPNHAAAFQFLAWGQFSAGDYLGAAITQERALELDPLNVSLVTESGWPYYYAGLYDISLERSRRAVELDPGFGLGLYNVASSLHGLGRYAEAIASYDRALEVMGSSPWMLTHSAVAHIEMGNRAKGEEALDVLRGHARAGIAAWLSIAMLLDALGRTAEALDAVERAFEQHEPFVWGMGLENWLKFPHARSHPRFQALMQKIGISAHDVAGQRALLLAHKAG